MGDTRISISILRHEESVHSTTFMLPADTALSELMDKIRHELELELNQVDLSGVGDGDSDNDGASKRNRNRNRIITFTSPKENDNDNDDHCNDNDNANASSFSDIPMPDYPQTSFPMPLHISVYNCTLHPPIDMTPHIHEYKNTTGPSSITLHSLHMFPSAKIVIFAWDDDKALRRICQGHNGVHVQDDYQYNLPGNGNGNYLS
eukprot:CAMPEP_0194121276 /NCGR_PEP_ID=MMETSP0150-20130528/46371_1 /TAXON_ID=122233 /ORGANISM="Chaetoceros debilis, Strain MM31A-1" /LENGTH=203 /DNA_ID=CAMNT_0038813643 /DNA_START=66 /DNA_END=674 /DNA_ORIENTATION=-